MSSQGQPEAPAMPDPVEESLNATIVPGKAALLYDGDLKADDKFGLLMLYGDESERLKHKYNAAPGGMVINFNDHRAAWRLEVVAPDDWQPGLFGFWVSVLNVRFYEQT